MKLSEELAWRGFINQTTFSDLTELDKKKWTFYHGFDASADSQTIGNLAAMMLDRAFMRYGHKAIILAGGATSLIGDPGGKDEERPLQDEKTIARNVRNSEQQLRQIYKGHSFKLVNNLDWTKRLGVIEYLRDIGKHFSMTPLIQRDYIANRLGEGGSGISYTEFSYTVLQGMDFLHLHDHHGVSLQLGGSDQWGNCLSGVELIRKARGQETHVITLPLIINKATGKKFGKSEAGAVWLDSQKTTVYQFYQFWLNADDDGVEDYLKIYTELDKPTIDELMSSFKKDRASRSAQKRLAYEVTKLVHGEIQAKKQQTIAEAIVKQDVSILNATEITTLKAEIPHTRAAPGTGIIAVLVKTGLASSNSDARRLIQGGAVYINGNVSKKDAIDTDDFKYGRLLVRKGKKLADSALVEQV